MKVAIQGCCHNSLPHIYDLIAAHESKHATKVDALFVCGDFQALRNEHDLEHMSSPARHKHLGQFHEFYSGKRVAPLLTIVVGGNHEASGYMKELYHGGWVAPNIYYLGGAGSVLVNGLRVCGVSGIYNERHYNKGHFEHPPFSKHSVRSAFAVREFDVARVMQLPPSEHTVVLTHDWPSGIAHYGDIPDLIKRKPLFKSDIHTNLLGTPSYMTLLKTLRPNYWFCGHHHTRFPAKVAHEDGAGPKVTNFLALSLPNRDAMDYLEFMDIPTPEPVTGAPRLTYDPAWLAITRAFHPYFSSSVEQIPLPDPGVMRRKVAKELEKINAEGFLVPDLTSGSMFDDPPLVRTTAPVDVAAIQHFVATAPPQGTGGDHRVWYTNSQTRQFCDMLGIEDKVNPSGNEGKKDKVHSKGNRTGR